MVLLDVAFQHDEQFGQFLASLCRTVRAFNAVVDVRVNQFFGQRFQAATGGNDLCEYLRAIAVLLQHPLDGTELADNFANADNGSATLFLGVLMMVIGHDAKISSIGALVKNGLSNMGYGGISLF